MTSPAYNKNSRLAGRLCRWLAWRRFACPGSFLRTAKTTATTGTRNDALFHFPTGFSWGTALSAFQAEGGWNLDGKGESIWDRMAHAGLLDNGDTGDVACDQYHRFEDDANLASRLNLNAYRLSIAWPRVQPLGLGAYNQAGIDFYDRCFDQLLERGITPFPTLYHWDLPQHLQDLGGWGNRDTTERFAEYSGEMARRFSDRVRHWTTFNEPWCVSFLGHANGYFAPGLKDEKLAAQVAHHLLVAHGKANKALRAVSRSDSLMEVGIVLNFPITEPFRADHPEDVALAEKAWRRDCGAYLDPLFRGVYGEETAAGIGDFRSQDLQIIQQPLDFLGINFYSRNVASAVPLPDKIPGSEYTDMGWEVTPAALRSLLNRIWTEYHPPKLYVTENGAAYTDTADASGRFNDQKRLDYVREHIKQVALSIKDGTNVAGYFVWSFLDNLEWRLGFSRRFGLVHVDFASLERTVKASGDWYANVAGSNAVDLGEAKSKE
jgi:beta-glucosidase